MDTSDEAGGEGPWVSVQGRQDIWERPHGEGKSLEGDPDSATGLNNPGSHGSDSRWCPMFEYTHLRWPMYVWQRQKG